MTVLIINPIAGKGNALRVTEEVEGWLRAQGHPYRKELTQYAGHAVELARSAAQDPDVERVFSVGGDGTVLEVVNGISGTQKPMGILPGGTGNDVAKSLGIPRDGVEAIRLMFSLKCRPLDIGQFNDRLFINAAGIGFDVETLDKAYTLGHRLPLKGMGPYLLGAVLTIFTHKDLDIQLRLNGKTIKGPFLLVGVANGATVGGGMRIAPEAKMDDGHFDACIIRHVPRWKVLFVLPTFLKGTHVKLPYVTMERVREVEFIGKNMRFQIDGEICQAEHAIIRVLPGALNILAPA